MKYVLFFLVSILVATNANAYINCSGKVTTVGAVHSNWGALSTAGGVGNVLYAQYEANACTDTSSGLKVDGTVVLLINDIDNATKSELKKMWQTLLIAGSVSGSTISSHSPDFKIASGSNYRVIVPYWLVKQ